MTDQIVSMLQPRLRGRVIGRDAADYDAARALYNGMIDKRPRLIARCVDVADVIAAVGFGREQDLLVAIHAGGHNGPGLGSCNDGLVINFMMDDEAEGRVQATYGGNYERLAAIKAKYDPNNFFRVNQNIAPAVA